MVYGDQLIRFIDMLDAEVYNINGAFDKGR